ncbi:hypothetical protein PI95_004525 [Hassallia byssoidea VB512170]|uniref:Uncharacterized protein n=1 Tax=Hassallia byssoidea VB512170 TaxID=1304833 RepID=A0A846H379_9CYAN|nr:hypothetical protein [Hassalia byssoidea]NEU71856.1 hypothetical protein [Hassalia byssoidea VB512170]
MRKLFYLSPSSPSSPSSPLQLGLATPVGFKYIKLQLEKACVIEVLSRQSESVGAL